MIVVDTNVIAYLILPCKYTEAVERLRSTDDEWIAPDLWIHEMLSILVQNERHGQLESSDCMEILEDALALMKENYAHRGSRKNTTSRDTNKLFCLRLPIHRIGA